MVQPDELITPQEVARAFGVTVKTVTRWAQREILPSVVTPGGHHRFWRSDVDELLYAGAPKRSRNGAAPTRSGDDPTPGRSHDDSAPAPD